MQNGCVLLRVLHFTHLIEAECLRTHRCRVVVFQKPPHPHSMRRGRLCSSPVQDLLGPVLIGLEFCMEMFQIPLHLTPLLKVGLTLISFKILINFKSFNEFQEFQLILGILINLIFFKELEIITASMTRISRA